MTPVYKFWNGFIVSVLVLSITGNIIAVNRYKHNKEHHDKALLFPYLSPRIFAENQNDILINFWPLRTRLREQVIPYKDTFAFFFEYLPSGVTVGVNEKVEFVGASLIKLPVAIAYLHQVERSGLNWQDRKVPIEKADIDPGFGTLWQSGEGAEISLDKAMETSLVESDNTAANVLKHHVSSESFNEVYEGLDIDIHEDNGKALISAKSYASILKALYFSSLISNQASQRILQLLAQTAFNDKLTAPLPPGITVAHKIGVYAIDNIYQDCGIVYVPKRPYILCMISHSDEETARERMSTISKIIYEFVSQKNGN